MKIVFTIILFLSTLFSFAQDKKDAQKKDEYKLSSTIKNVRGYLKDKKYSNANDAVNQAVKEHAEARSSAQLYALQSQALQNLVLEENKKMYLNQKPDTTKYLNFIYALYESALTCDSLDQIPDQKGKVQLKYRDTNQQRLLQFRKNLATADKYFYQKKDYKNAYKFVDLFLDSRKAAIFSTSKGQAAVAAEDTVASSFLAVFFAYAYDNYKGVVKHLDVAMNDTARLAQILQVGSTSYYALGDTASAHALLFQGVEKYPTDEYFYLTLLKYYNSKGQYEEALELVNSVLVHLPDNRNCWFLKAKEHEYLHQYEEALEALEHVVGKHEDDFEAYSNIGTINITRAHKEYENFNLKVTDKGYTKGRQKINDIYKKALVAFEKCRKLADKTPELWLEGLRECYYKLNLGKELKALEKIK